MCIFLAMLAASEAMLEPLHRITSDALMEYDTGEEGDQVLVYINISWTELFLENLPFYFQSLIIPRLVKILV